MSDEIKNNELENDKNESVDAAENNSCEQKALDVSDNDEPAASEESEVKECKTENDNNEDCACEIKASEETQDLSDNGVKTEETSAPSFGGGIAYVKNVDGETSNCYEWNSQQQDSDKPSKKKVKKEPSGTGFRVFLSVVLSVFTVSVVTLTVMVIGYINNPESTAKDNVQASSSGSVVKDLQTSDEFDYNSITLQNPNYVAFDFKAYENGEVLSVPEIAAKCSPSSVGIVSQVEMTYNYPFYFGGSSSRIAEASGSGFIYSAEGYVITNHHVIEDAKKVTVILHDGTEYEAEVVGSDSLSDIAVLKITPDEGVTLVPMEIGNSDELVVGEPVVAIGCPAGIEFIGTVTDGIVSSINRNVELTDDYGTEKTMTLIQTNATINHGNSGGPLINAKGQVIGINTLKLSADYEGIGFSIPMNGALTVISQLIEHGEVVERTEDDFAYGKGIIGINGSAISESESEYYGIPQGVLVIQIDRESSAAKAGLRRGDIITHYNGKKVTTVDEINQAKNSARAGTEVTVTVYRDGVNGGDGETIDITFKLDSQQ